MASIAAARPPTAGTRSATARRFYFWSLIVAMLLFAMGGGLSLYEGIVHIRNPEPIRDPVWNYAVLGIAFVAEGISWGIAVREMAKDKKPGESYFRTFQRSKDPAIFVVVAEDTAALLGIVVAFVGILLAVRLEESCNRRDRVNGDRRDPGRRRDPAGL